MCFNWCGRPGIWFNLTLTYTLFIRLHEFVCNRNELTGLSMSIILLLSIAILSTIFLRYRYSYHQYFHAGIVPQYFSVVLIIGDTLRQTAEFSAVILLRIILSAIGHVIVD